MQVAVLHFESTCPESEIGVQRALAKRCIESVRKHMPYSPIVHLTDEVTPDLTDIVIRSSRKGYFIPWTLDLFSKVAGETLFLDSDTVVQEDVSNVFNHPFDVALVAKPTRFGQHTDRNGVKHYMPINLGVAFSRATKFWRELKGRVEKHTDPNILGWWGSQIEVWNMYQNPGEWKVVLLDESYNYTPNSEDEVVSDKAIVHYKGGHRKHWGLEGFAPRPRVREVVIHPSGNAMRLG